MVEATRLLFDGAEMRLIGRYSREVEDTLAVGVGFRYAF
jgi:hypothetical protein